MEFALLITLLIFCIVLYSVMARRQRKYTATANKTIMKYSVKPLMTPAERDFYAKLHPLFQNDMIVLPQVPLSAIINKDSPSKYRTELFRTIDYGVFDKEYKPLALIELNDETHTQPNRARRDARVKSIATSANLPLIKFYNNMPNEQSYVISRILNTIRGGDE